MSLALSRTAMIFSRRSASLAIALAVAVTATSSAANADSRRPFRPADGLDAGVSADESTVHVQRPQEVAPADPWAAGGAFASVSGSLGFMNLYWNWAGRPISIIGGGTGVHGMAGYRFGGGGFALFADADYETTLAADAGEQSMVSFDQAWFDQVTVGPGAAWISNSGFISASWLYAKARGNGRLVDGENYSYLDAVLADDGKSFELEAAGVGGRLHAALLHRFPQGWAIGFGSYFQLLFLNSARDGAVSGLGFGVTLTASYL